MISTNQTERMVLIDFLRFLNHMISKNQTERVVLIDFLRFLFNSSLHFIFYVPSHLPLEKAKSETQKCTKEKGVSCFLYFQVFKVSYETRFGVKNMKQNVKIRHINIVKREEILVNLFSFF